MAGGGDGGGRNQAESHKWWHRSVSCISSHSPQHPSISVPVKYHFGEALALKIFHRRNPDAQVILAKNKSVQFSSVQSLSGLDRPGDMTDDSAEILFLSFLQEALVGSAGMGSDVHSLMLSIQHFLG